MRRSYIFRFNRWYASCLLMVLIAVAAAPAFAERRLRIAILPFDVPTDKQQVANRMGVTGNLGLRLSDLLLTKVVQDGHFSVIERSRLDAVLHEQNQSNSDRFDTNSAARIGKVLGVDAIVMASVTEFTAENKKSSTGGLIASKFTRLNGAAVEQQTSKVTITISGHIVSVSTGEILAAATGLGDSSSSHSNFRQAGSNSNIGSTSSTQSFGSPLVDDATAKAIGSMAEQLEGSPQLAALATVPEPVAPKAVYNGVVADVTGKTLILTVGTKDGLKIGDVVEISRPGRTIKNPTTGAILKIISDPLGEATIVEADASSATATYAGTATVKVNDAVASKP